MVNGETWSTKRSFVKPVNCETRSTKRRDSGANADEITFFLASLTS